MKEEDKDWHTVEDLHRGSHVDHKEFLRGIGGWRMSMPKLCDVCQVSNSVLYCRAHTAQLCLVCDVKIHGGSKASLCHERVWVCEVCEQAPAVVTCKADAAALCVACDTDIHSANPLASRHERAPVIPFYECPNMPNNNTATNANNDNLDCNVLLNEDGGGDDPLKHDYVDDDYDDYDDDENDHNNLLNHQEDDNDAEICCAEEAATASWLIPEANRNNLTNINGGNSEGEDKMVKDKLKFKAYMQSIDFLQDVENYVDLEYLGTTTTITTPTTPTAHMGADSMVPVHTPEVIEHSSTKVSVETARSLDVDAASKCNYVYRTTSLNHCVSSSSIDVGIVPDSNTTTDISTPYHDPRGVFEIPPRVVHPGGHVEVMGREARVLRYREKRKNRRFEKTIRYASRKAYAETRPRIKGRFAKRTEVEVEQIYSSSLLPDQGYGVVPSY